MELRILGPVEMVGGDGSFSLPEGRGRALLTILALHPGRIVSTDQLIDQLWGETPPVTARTKLHGLVSTLRRILEPDRRADADPVLLQTQPPGYVLAVDPDQVDAFRFRRLVGTAAELPMAEKARVLTEALELWRGPALADFTYAPFAQTEITSLEELRICAIEDRITAELHLGRHTALVPELEALIAENPFRERLRAQAMLAQYRSGNQQRALSVYRDAYNTLTEELGIEPGPELQDLEDAILTHDPALDGMPAAVGGPYGSEILEERSAAETWLSDSRRFVTVMYVDLTMPASVRPDPEAHGRVTRKALGTIGEVLHRHGGTAQGSIGGVSVGVFGIPMAHEDDPLRAVRAALETIQALTAPDADDNGPVARIGVNTGEIVVGDPGLGNSGLPEDTARVAGRLQQAADANEVLIGDRTRQLVSHEVSVEPVRRRILDDAGNPLTAWRLVEADPSSSGHVSPPDTPWVGRDTELTRLQQVFRSAVDRGRPQRVTVIGPAGIGKSRLASEFGSAIGGEARVLTGHCPPYGSGITFWPLREIIDQAGGDVGLDAIRRLLGSTDGAESIANHVAAAVGSTEAPHRPDVLFPAIRRFMVALARERPLVLILEDLHWGQPTFVELIRYLTDSVEARLMFLCLARPEFLDQRPAWPEAPDNGETLMLDALDPDSVDQLVGFYLAKRGVSFDEAQQAIGAAEGNPLFIEQIMAAFGDHDQPTIPLSIQALLVARLDQLGPAERDLIRAASVLGRRFKVIDLMKLIPEGARETAPSHLESLERRALIAEAGDDAFDFRHALIQLVSYQTLTKESRAKLHAQAGELLERSGAGDSEVDEIVGYHFEQAFGYRSELGLDDDTSRRLGARAAERLTRAGLRAFARFDVPAAENLLTRAEPLLRRHHSDWWAVVRRLAEADQVMGRHDKAIRAFDHLIEEAESSGDEAIEYFFRLERVWALIAIGPDPISLETLESEIGRGREVFEALEDDAGLAQVFRLMLHIHYRRGRMAEMEEAGRRDLEHAIKSGHPREVIGGQWLLAMAFEEGPRPVRECIEACEGILRWRGAENPGVVSTMGYLWAMAGDFDTARRLAAKAQEILRERVRARRPLGQVVRRAGDVELLAGDVEAAERELRRALELNLDMGENDMVCQIAASLSRILGRRGEIDEAERLAAMSEHHAPAQSVTSQALWRSVKARVLSLHRQPEKARSLAEEAVELVPADMLNLRAEVSLDLGEVLLKVGHRDLGTRAISDAIDLYQQKGNVVGSAQAKATLS